MSRVDKGGGGARNAPDLNEVDGSSLTSCVQDYTGGSIGSAWWGAACTCNMGVRSAPCTIQRCQPLPFQHDHRCHCVHTRCLKHTDVLMKQEEVGPWPSATEHAGVHHTVPAGGRSGTPAAGAAATSALPLRYSLRSGTSGAGGASGGQQTSSCEQQHALSSLVITNERLGTGKCGGVFVGRCAHMGLSAQLSAQQLAGSRGKAQALLRLSLNRLVSFRFDTRPLMCLDTSQKPSAVYKAWTSKWSCFSPCRFYGQPAAIKAIDASKQGHLLPKMRAEVAIYSGTIWDAAARFIMCAAGAFCNGLSTAALEPLLMPRPSSYAWLRDYAHSPQPSIDCPVLRWCCRAATLDVHSYCPVPPQGGSETKLPPFCQTDRADRLRTLQGVCIPALYGCGFWDDGRTYFVATSIVAGQLPGRSMRGGSQAAEQVGMLRRLCSSPTVAAQSSHGKLAWGVLLHHILSCIVTRTRHRSPFAWIKGCAIMPSQQVLRQLHAQGILHGDIRAENIFVAVEDGRWKVMHHSP